MRVGSGWLGGGNGDWAIGATCVRRAADGAAEDGGPDDMDGGAMRVRAEKTEKAWTSLF